MSHKDNCLPMPEYEKMHVWESYAADLMVDLKQCEEEGKDVEALREVFEAVSHLPATAYRARLADILFAMTLAAPVRADYPYNEPSTPEEIRALCPKNVPECGPIPQKDELFDRVLGAWLGRSCGCLLGKPVEGMRTNELHPLLRMSGNWPMHRYIVSGDITDEMKSSFKFPVEGRCWADTVECAPVDDDTNYVVLAQVLIEKYGRNFTPADMAQVWLDYQPKGAYCTAERVAFCNFVKGYRPPQSAVYQNPYREWIGAQIRGDYFGYINPGDPDTAADMAWRDASISHIKNGIYGEMWAAAMIAQAAVDEDIESIIRAGLARIPATSRLYEAVERVIGEYRSGRTVEEVMARIHQMWDEHSSHDWCHTISNAEIVAMALLYGEGDYGNSICLAVQTGFDTDCNGATVGSILGMRGGSKAVGEEWTKPVNGMLDTSIFGVGRVDLREMAKKTMEHMG